MRMVPFPVPALPVTVRLFLGSRTRTGLYARGPISGTGLCHFPFLILDGARSGRAAALLLQSVYQDSFVNEHLPEPENKEKRNGQCSTGNGISHFR